MPTIKARPSRFQESDPTAKPTAGVSRPRPKPTAVPQRPSAGGLSRPRPGATSTPSTGSVNTPGSTGGTFVPSDVSDPTAPALPEDDGLTLQQYQPGLSMQAKLAIGAAVLVGLVGLVLTVRRRVRGDVREGS